jgi:predicted phage terminase large subunit-like protein
MRFNAQTAVIEQGRVWLPHEAPWRESLLHELTTFPKSTYDDQVDSVAQALAWMTQCELTPEPGIFVF